MSMPETKAARAAEGRARLAEAFPACFAPKARQKLPLAIGIRSEIREKLPTLSVAKLKAALKDYTSGPTYLRNVTAGADRIGLDGEPSGTVTEEQAEHAAQRLAKLNRRPPPSRPLQTVEDTAAAFA